MLIHPCSSFFFEDPSPLFVFPDGYGKPPYNTPT